MAWNEYKTDEQKVTWGVGLTLDGTGRFPLIAKRIWETLADAQAWVDDTSTDSTATPGLILSIINDDNEENNGVYRVVSIADSTHAGVLEKIGSNDISLENYQEVEYNEAFVNSSAVTKSDDIVGALNKVEATLSSLVDETISNELTTTKAFVATADACGITDKNGVIKYTINEHGTNYLASTVSITDAVETLDSVVKDMDDDLSVLKQIFTIERDESGNITATLDCGTY